MPQLTLDVQHWARSDSAVLLTAAIAGIEELVTACQNDLVGTNDGMASPEKAVDALVKRPETGPMAQGNPMT
jgi:hypothetical protein